MSINELQAQFDQLQEDLEFLYEIEDPNPFEEAEIAELEQRLRELANEIAEY